MMKKMFGKKLAFLLAACVLTAGAFVACKNGEESEESAASSLASPVGADPFKTGTYRVVYTCIDPENNSLYTDTYIEKFDTKRRIMTQYIDETETLKWADQMTYTYNNTEKTVTMAYYRSTIPTDIDAYISADTENTDYTGEWKFVPLDDYIAFKKNVCNAQIAERQKKINSQNISEQERKRLQDEIEEIQRRSQSIEKEMKDISQTTFVWSYATDDGNITLTLNNSKYGDKEVLTFIN